MVYGVVLAGGIGSRMGNVEKPKQYLFVGGKPILVHTLEKFCVNSEIDRVIVLCPSQWISYTRDLLKKYMDGAENVDIIQGGPTRNDTIMNAIAHIETKYGVEEDTIMVTHDAVRPFVTHRIIRDNIKALAEYPACDTVVQATDTIVESMDHKKISQIPDRSKYYQGQTPQSFRAAKFKELYNSLTQEEKSILTDAAKVFVMKGEEVALVPGEYSNIKITYPYDLQLAETLLGGEKKC